MDSLKPHQTREHDARIVTQYRCTLSACDRAWGTQGAIGLWIDRGLFWADYLAAETSVSQAVNVRASGETLLEALEGLWSRAEYPHVDAGRPSASATRLADGSTLDRREA